MSFLQVGYLQDMPIMVGFEPPGHIFYAVGRFQAGCSTESRKVPLREHRGNCDYRSKERFPISNSIVLKKTFVLLSDFFVNLCAIMAETGTEKEGPISLLLSSIYTVLLYFLAWVCCLEVK